MNILKLTLVMILSIAMLTGCGGGGGSSSNPVATPTDDQLLKADYPEIYNSYASVQAALENNVATPAERVDDFTSYVANDFKDIDGNLNKKTELYNTTKSRLERYYVNSYKFVPLSHEVASTTEITVKTYMYINVSKLETPGVVFADIPITQDITWRKNGALWQIYQGLPYKSSELSF
ncbi:MAG: hypothetical protein KKB51_14230 [Candidatus Riflebacteria bacterium]|nr:hypothetical protein [Candidatus Riflebacteria bacterium]